MTDEEQMKEVMKAAVKESIKEWLDSKFSQFGKWTATAIAAMAFAALAYFILWANGWHKP